MSNFFLDVRLDASDQKVHSFPQNLAFTVLLLSCLLDVLSPPPCRPTRDEGVILFSAFCMPLTQAVRMCRPCCPSSGRPSSGSLRLSRRARSQGSASWYRAASLCSSSWRQLPRREYSRPASMHACRASCPCAANQMRAMHVQQEWASLHAWWASMHAAT